MPRQIVGRFTVSHLQILDENGRVDKKLEPDIPDSDLIQIYEKMSLSREFDGRMLKLQRQGRIGTFPPTTGQEVAHMVPAYLMHKNDWFVGAFRETGARLMLGETMEQALYFYNGFEEGNARPKGVNILPVSIIVSSHALHAVGLAYAMKYKGIKDSIAVSFMGDGATSQGDFHEALNFAGVWQVPVVFIVQNNHWAISTPREKQTSSKTLAQKAIAYDIPGIQVDGNDPLAMWVATQEAFDRARSGKGATLIEAVTYRLMMHTTADDPKKYRTDEEVSGWELKDPLKRTKLYLESRKIWNAQKQKELDEKVKLEVDNAVKTFEATTSFKPDAPFDYVYTEPHYTTEEQRQEFLEELRREAGNV